MNIEFNEPPKKEGFEDMNFRLYNLNKENNPNDIFSHLFVFPEQNNYSLVWLGQIDFNDLEKIALGKIPTYQRQRRFFKDFYLNITRNLMQKTLLGTKLIKDEFDNLDYKNGDIQIEFPQMINFARYDVRDTLCKKDKFRYTFTASQDNEWPELAIMLPVYESISPRLVKFIKDTHIDQSFINVDVKKVAKGINKIISLTNY
ncbi:MAG: hypothetical protein QT05_C0006G0025 [archaeon GW2011_AR13]|nr:MAG: hypothetical protein QT05_C0006G0025 [archaeon GW2011_AR13]HIG95221.1 hypothetical protein [Nanoarchaeota archaeon]HIH63102.1 hypothetical protein [Nanoarchaeota archaeon]HIJ09157.1 hypothetical protein [Nanoarchaeota archaeon]